jgi:hypothetical protein
MSNDPKPAPTHREQQAFVDVIESGMVTLLLQDEAGEWRGYRFPTMVLPEGTKEGSWLRLTVTPSTAPPAAQNEELRRKLSATDSGEDFSL